MGKFIGLAIAVIAAVVGITFQADPWALARIGSPADQKVLAHRDSPYTHVTWAISEGDNSAELRFYDRVEGGVCLQPAWDQLADFGLSHLAMPPSYPVQRPPPGPTWPADKPKPNPGTLTNTRYINLYPAAILLNDHLFKRAGGDMRKLDPHILIVGLGSGVGIGILAHHFPEATITCVDIDQAVIDMVEDHYPMLRWLANEAPPTTAGKKRLRMVQRDARQYIYYDQSRPDPEPYDLIIVDAYTAGSTIPPHLMTQEFYEECKDTLAPGGMLLSNIIGSYTGPQREVLGGAIRSQRAAGLEYVHNFPIVWRKKDAEMDPKTPRNNMVLSAVEPLDPDARPDAWKRLQEFSDSGALYKEFPLGRFTGTIMNMYQLDNEGMAEGLTSEIALDDLVEIPAFAELHSELDERLRRDGEDGAVRINDAALLGRIQEVVNRHYPGGRPAGWNTPITGQTWLYYKQMDWVAETRRVLAYSLNVARAQTGLRYDHSGELLVGPLEDQRDDVPPTWKIKDAPLFTDSRPNADLYNH